MITRLLAVPRLVTDIDIRCARCNRGLARQATRPWSIMCPRCKHVNISRLRSADALMVSDKHDADILAENTKKSRRKKKVDSRRNTE